MNRQQIFDAFDGKISKSAIRDQGMGMMVYGKHCELEYMGSGLWDLYLRNPNSPASKLSGRRINQFREKFQQTGLRINLLDGEAWCQGELPNGLGKCILSELKWLGIRKAPQYSPEQLEALRERMRNIRKA